MNWSYRGRRSHLRRGGRAILVAGTALMAVTVVPPAGAHHGPLGGGVPPASIPPQGTLISYIDTNNPGAETHAGVPIAGPTDPPCAIFTAYTYDVAFPTAATGTVEVVSGGTTYRFSHLDATVNSRVNQWYEGPTGTFTHAQCAGSDPANPNPPENISGFTLALAGTDDSGNVLDCTAGPGSDDYYIRTDLNVKYHFGGVACDVNGAGASGFTTVDFNLALATTPLPADPIFGWNTYCTGPIAPAGCLSEGTVTFN